MLTAIHTQYPPLKRLAYGLAFVGLLTGAIVLAGVGAWQVWTFFVLPDVALLLGAGRGLRPGQVHPRAVRLYNALHVFTGPAVLAVLGVWLGPAWLAGALAWAAHVAMDRAAGYRLRDREGFIRAG